MKCCSFWAWKNSFAFLISSLVFGPQIYHARVAVVVGCRLTQDTTSGCVPWDGNQDDCYHVCLILFSYVGIGLKLLSEILCFEDQGNGTCWKAVDLGLDLAVVTCSLWLVLWPLWWWACKACKSWWQDHQEFKANQVLFQNKQNVHNLKLRTRKSENRSLFTYLQLL